MHGKNLLSAPLCHKDPRHGVENSGLSGAVNKLQQVDLVRTELRPTQVIILHFFKGSKNPVKCPEMA